MRCVYYNYYEHESIPTNWYFFDHGLKLVALGLPAPTGLLSIEIWYTAQLIFTNRVTEILLRNFHKKKEVQVELSEREIEFLELACTELPYKSFAPC